MERKWHFIGRAFVCHKGGFQHEHLKEQNCLSCTGENIRTEQKQKYEQLLNDKNSEIAAEKSKIQVCNKGGFMHEHLSADDAQRCEGENIRTEQKQKYEQLLNDKDLEIAAEKSKIQVCYKGGFMHEHSSADDAQKCVGEDMKTKRKQEHEKYLKDQDVKIAVEQTRRTEIEQTMETKRVETVEETKRVEMAQLEETKREEMRANRERQRAEEHLNEMRIQHAHDIKMKRLEMEVSANNMESSRVEELVNSVCDLLIRINQSTDHGSTLNQGSLLPVRQTLNEWM